MSLITEWHIGHLAAAPEMSYVDTAEGRVARAHMVVISNERRKDKKTGELREESTSIRYTLWRADAENAAKFLGKGAHVAVKAKITNNTFEKDGKTEYGFNFTAIRVRYLDSKAAAEARAARVPEEDDDIPL
jgi:single-stranded DNA-binding protein